MSDDNDSTKNVTAGTGGVGVGGDVHGNVSVSNIIAPTINFLHQLPAPPRDFVGREKELKAILGDMDRGVTISGLQGQGGVGKTALALVVAQKLLARYPDAQFFIDLQGVTQPTKPIEAMSQIVRAYHPEARLPDDEKQIRNLYLGVLNNQRALLVLDNAKDKEHVLPLLPPSSCCLIVTSREHFTLPGLQAQDIEVMSPDDARDLLTTIAPLLTHHDSLITNNLASLCAYLPLALRAAASTLAETPDLDPQKFVAQLRDEKARLSLAAETANNEMISVEASLNLSYARLSEHAQRVFCALSVFPADFDSRAAEVVGEDEEHKGLSELVKRSLVNYKAVALTPTLSHNETHIVGEGEDSPVEEGVDSPLPKMPLGFIFGRGVGGEGRYKIHDLSRLFASHRLPDAERYATQLRHAKHYLEVIRTTGNLYEKGGDSITQGLALFDLERVNIEHGQKWASENAENDDAAQVCNDYPNAGVYVINLRLHSRIQIRWMEDALNAARQLKNRQYEGAHLGNLGLAYADLGETRKAIEYQEQRLNIVREIEDRLGEGQVLGNLGNAYYLLGETRKAIEYQEQRLKIVREIGDRHGEGQALGNLGVAYKNLGETRKAIEFYEQDLVIAREIGDRRGEGADLGNLGSAYADLGETRKAIEFYEQDLVIAREIRDRRAEGSALTNLGSAYGMLGETRKAVEFYEQALKIVREIGDRRGEGFALQGLGVAYKNLGETRKAIEFYEQQLEIVREIGDRRGEGNALWNMSLAFDKLGERAKAISLSEDALKILEAIEDPRAGKVRKKLEGWRGAGSNEQ